METTAPKVVAHVRGGKLVKGYLISLPGALETMAQQPVALPRQLTIDPAETGAPVVLQTSSLKALYFVRTFAGSKEYNEIKYFSVAPEIEGLWVRLKYFDNESTEGLIHNALPSFADSGFLMKLPDPFSNNQMAYVLKNSLVELKVLGVKRSF